MQGLHQPQLPLANGFLVIRVPFSFLQLQPGNGGPNLVQVARKTVCGVPNGLGKIK